MRIADPLTRLTARRLSDLIAGEIPL